jgi:hypothetical protein
VAAFHELMNPRSFAISLLERTKALFANVYFLTIVGSLVFVWIAFGGHSWIAYVFLAALFVGGFLAFVEKDYVSRQIEGLSKYSVRVVDDALVQLDDSGDDVGRIDLTIEFHVSVPYRTSAAGIIRVVQGDQIVDFPSTMPEAESIARNVLGMESWPPEAHWIPPF